MGSVEDLGLLEHLDVLGRVLLRRTRALTEVRPRHQLRVRVSLQVTLGFSFDGVCHTELADTGQGVLLHPPRYLWRDLGQHGIVNEPYRTSLMRFDYIPFFNPGKNIPWDRVVRMMHEQTQLAERAGFTAVWLTEHHLLHNG